MNTKQIDYCIELAHTLNFRKISGNPRLFNCRDESALRRQGKTEQMFCFSLPCFLLYDILYV